MLSAPVLKALNNQVTMEFHASNVYLQYSAWADSRGLTGCSAFLRKHSEEERAHMQKIFDYIQASGEMPILGHIEAPEASFENIEDLFQAALKHEEAVTASITKIYTLALAEKDYATVGLMQWSADEQHEEEDLVRRMLDRIALIGINNPSALLFIDKEAEKISAHD